MAKKKSSKHECFSWRKPGSILKKKAAQEFDEHPPSDVQSKADSWIEPGAAIARFKTESIYSCLSEI